MSEVETTQCGACGATSPAREEWCGTCSLRLVSATAVRPKAKRAKAPKRTDKPTPSVTPELAGVATAATVVEPADSGAGRPGAEDLFTLTEPYAETSEGPRSTRRFPIRATVAVGCAVTVAASIVVGAMIWGVPRAEKPSAVATASTSVQLVTLPGFAESSSWTSPMSASKVVMSPDRLTLGQLTAAGVVVTDQSGAGARLIEGNDLGLTTGVVDGAAQLIVTTAGAVILVSADTTPVTVRVPEGASFISRGAGTLVLSGQGRSTVGVLTTSGVVPYLSPATGSVPAGVLPGGSIQWVSARGQLYTATAAGTAAAPVQLAAPAPGARVSRALAGGAIVTTVWTLADGSAVVATHTADGALTGQAPSTSASPSLLLAPGGSVAMSGSIRIDLATGALTVPDPAFQARTPLADGVFYGGTASNTAIQDRSGQTSAVPTPQAVPIGVTASGSLVVLQPTGHAALVPKASPRAAR